MPQLASIAINDGETTPVTHTFAPVTTTGTKAKLANRSAAIPKGFEVLESEVVFPKSETGAYRIMYNLQLPEVATVDGQPTIVNQDSVSLVFNFSQKSSSQRRKNARTLTTNLLANATIQSMIDNIEPQY